MDTIHPIVVHFVIAMAVFSVVFDLIGVLTRRTNLFEFSFWNLLFATAAIFVAVIFGQVEAGLAEPYGWASEILNLHSTLGWSLVGILSLLTGWRYVIRSRDPQSLPLPSCPPKGCWPCWWRCR
jgi:Predicted membrane protein